MKASLFLLVTQVAICCALAASSALYVHYLDPVASEFCGLESGCEAVRRTPVAYFGSRFVSLPLFAVLAYAGLLALSLRCRPSSTQPPATSTSPLGLVGHLRASPPLALFAATGLGALCAIALIAYQAFGLRQYCWLCLIVDTAAIVAAVAAFGVAHFTRPLHSLPRPIVSPLHMSGTASWLVAGPLLWTAVQAPPAVPTAVSELYEPGKINVVEFADFQCPHCRKLHSILAPLVQEYGDKVHFLRLNKPLRRHKMAEHAARAAVCATVQHKGEEMADRLFTSELSSDSIALAAQALKLDTRAFADCLLSPTTQKVLDDHAARLSEEEFKGLPTTYIGQHLVIGVRSEAAFRDAFDRALRPAPPSLSGLTFVGLWALLLFGFWGAAWQLQRRNQELG